MANRFEIAHLTPKGSITGSQEARLRTYSPATLATARQALGIFGPIPKLSKQQAWKLINRISQDVNGGAA